MVKFKVGDKVRLIEMYRKEHISDVWGVQTVTEVDGSPSNRYIKVTGNEGRDWSTNGLQWELAEGDYDLW